MVSSFLSFLIDSMELLSYFLQNKVFIYRGNEFEQLNGFKMRLQIQFPGAQVRNKEKISKNRRVAEINENSFQKIMHCPIYHFDFHPQFSSDHFLLLRLNYPASDFYTSKGIHWAISIVFCGTTPLKMYCIDLYIFDTLTFHFLSYPCSFSQS